MNILVTGATGFLGGYVVDRLLKEGHTVIAVGRSKYKLNELRNKGVKTECVDISNISQCEKCFEKHKIDTIIHTAALSTVWGNWDDFYSANVIGTRNIVSLASKYNIKLIHISSPSIYASKNNSEYIKEDGVNKQESLNYYIESKKLAEKEIIEHNEFKWVILRPRAIIGIGDSSIIPRLMKANKTIGIPLVNNGENNIDVTAVENVVEAIMLCINNENANGNIFNITNDECVTFKEVVELYFKEINKSPRYLKIKYKTLLNIAETCENIWKTLKIKKEPPLTVYTATTIGSTQTLNIDKAKDILGYKPIITTEEAIKQYAKWYNKSQQ